MIQVGMHIQGENYKFYINTLTDTHALNIKSDDGDVVLFATAAQLLELSNEITLYLATERLKAEAADDAESDTGEEEDVKPEYICPNAQRHKLEGSGFEVITDNAPESHAGKIICSVCGAHIKWESKAEMRKRERMTLGKDECEREGEEE